jgi:hypothetical protein
VRVECNGKIRPCFLPFNAEGALAEPCLSKEDRAASKRKCQLLLIADLGFVELAESLVVKICMFNWLLAISRKSLTVSHLSAHFNRIRWLAVTNKVVLLTIHKGLCYKATYINASAHSCLLSLFERRCPKQLAQLQCKSPNQRYLSPIDWLPFRPKNEPNFLTFAQLEIKLPTI